MFDSNLRTLLKDLFCFLVSKISGRKLNLALPRKVRCLKGNEKPSILPEIFRKSCMNSDCRKPNGFLPRQLAIESEIDETGEPWAVGLAKKENFKG